MPALFDYCDEKNNDRFKINKTAGSGYSSYKQYIPDTEPVRCIKMTEKVLFLTIFVFGGINSISYF